MATDVNVMNLVGLGFLKLYSSEEPLRYIMHCIGITVEKSRNKIINHGYDSIQSIVKMYPNDSEGFKKYMDTLNKTYAIVTASMQVYYSPKVIARCCALLF